jgi:acetoin utilization deacetylase AcuC-like enzyme
VNPSHVVHFAPGHPERPQRVDAILQAVKRSGLGLQLESAPSAPESLILNIHEQSYIASLEKAAASGGGYLDPDTYITELSLQASRTACGAVVEGVARVLGGQSRHAFAVVRPPGHHAERALAMGFCLINNVAVGVAKARAEGIERVAVIDFDVHHGNGTQHSFEDDRNLLYVSTHQYPYYPGTGSADERGRHGNVINLPLAEGTGDAAFLGAYAGQVAPALKTFKPELLLVSAGFDAHEDDPLAGLQVTTEGYGRLAAMIKEWAHLYSQGRTVWALEGGYNLQALGDSAVACLEVLHAE